MKLEETVHGSVDLQKPVNDLYDIIDSGRNINKNFLIGDFVKIIKPQNEQQNSDPEYKKIYNTSNYYLSFKGYHCEIIKKQHDFYWVYILSTPDLKKIKIHKDFLLKIN
jgi:hypothetical protein